MMSKLTREDCVYTSCYCEENIWKLCEEIKKNDIKSLDNCHVVFVSNHTKQVPIWFQKSGHKRQDYLCVWDYHVFLIKKCPIEGALVYDFDTVLDFPSSFDVYVRKALKPEWNFRYERLFRVIPSNIYLTTFASDRSHMKRPDGSFMSEPPAYMPIFTKDSINNIHEFISMNPDMGCGEVMDMQSFCQYFMLNQ